MEAKFHLSKELSKSERMIWVAVFSDQIQREHKEHKFTLRDSFVGGRALDAIRQADAVIKLLRHLGHELPLEDGSFCYVGQEE